MMKKLWNQFLRYLGIHHTSLVEGLYMLYSPMTRQDDGNFEGHQEFSPGCWTVKLALDLTRPGPPYGGLVREIPVISVET